MRKKVLTPECNKCSDCVTNDNNQLTCTWGKGEPKIMEKQKGRKKYHCKLIGQT